MRDVSISRERRTFATEHPQPFIIASCRLIFASRTIARRGFSTIIENNRKQQLLKNEERSLLSPFDEIFLGESTARRIKTGEGKSRTRHRQFSGGNGVIHDWEKGFRNNWFGLLKTRQRFPSCGQRSKGVTACVLSEVYAPFGRTPWPGLRPPFLLLDFRQRVAREAGRQRSERSRI